MYLTAASQPWVLVRVLQSTAQSITSQAGQPCRPALELYTNTVDNYITSVQNIDATMSGHTLTTIPVKNIMNKAVLISTNKGQYVINMPNKSEHN